MRATLLSVLTVSVMALPAAAQPVVPLPGAPMNWQGFYAGLTAGLGSSKLTFDDDGWSSGDGIRSDRDSGFLFGAYAGYNVLLQGNWLAGVEVDWSHLSGDRSITYDADTGVLGDSGDKISVRGRVGYLFDRALIYGTAGFAFGNPEARWHGDDGISSYSAKETKWKVGFIGGAGVEYGLTSNVLVRLEGLYTQYGWHDAPLDPDIAYDNVMKAKNSDFTVRAGIAYKF